MTRLWTEPAPEPDATLNARLAYLSEGLSGFFDGKPLVFHDAGGTYAPVIDDPERIHVQIHGVPRLANNKASAVRESQMPLEPFEYGAFAQAPRLYACTSRELINVNALARGVKNTRLFQIAGNTLFLLVRPSKTDERDTLDLELLAELLIHGMMARTLGDRFINKHTPSRAVQMVDASWFTRQTRDVPALSAVPQLIETIRLRRSVRKATRIAQERKPLYLIRRNHHELASRITNLERETEAAREAFRQQQARLREGSVASDRDRLKDAFAEQLQAIARLPQVEWVEVTPRHNRTCLAVHVAPLALGRDQRDADEGTAVLAPLRIEFQVGRAERHAITVTDIYDNQAPHPHVRGHPCLGSIQQDITQLLNDRDYVGATTLMLGYLQTYNAQDQWGQIGPRWPGFSARTKSGNRVDLPAAATP